MKSYSSETVNFPSNLEICHNGDTILKLEGKGNEYLIEKSNEKRNSDLYVKVKVSEHDYFKRKGNDIITTNFITASQYVLGGKIKILTIHGVREIDIPRYEDKLEIIGWGVGNKGKHIINFQIRLPTSINNDQRKIYDLLKSYDI